LAGYARDHPGGIAKFYLVKTDASGNRLWNYTYGTSESSEYIASSIVQTDDEGFVLAGFNSTGGDINRRDSILIKTDSSGNFLWEKKYGTLAGNEQAYSVVQTFDGGLAFAGWTNSTAEADYDFYLVKTSSAGDLQWERTYGGIDHDFAYSLVQTWDAGYALAGISRGSSDILLVKTDVIGNMLWNRTYPGMVSSHGSVSMIQANDGGLVMTASISPTMYAKDTIFLIKTDSEEGLCWSSSAPNKINLYRGSTDPWWNYVRVQIWKIK
jgi:hypothetical protein